MKTINELTQEQEQKVKALNIEIEMQKKFFDLTGLKASIISPLNKPFATFSPKTKEEYLTILNALQPTDKNATVDFSGKDSIQTFSPYLITYGGRHNTPNYMEVTVKFNTPICKVWVRMPDEVKNEKFDVASLKGEHKGFGNYETLYTLSANVRTTIQGYYGDYKTMYAANEEEASKLKEIIFN